MAVSVSGPVMEIKLAEIKIMPPSDIKPEGGCACWLKNGYGRVELE